MSVPPESAASPQGGRTRGGRPGADERQWALFAHLSALLGAFITGWVGGWGWFIGPLVIWLVKKDSMPFAGSQAKEALNFNITVAIAFVVLYAVTLVTFGVGIVITGPLMALLGIAALVLIIVAAVKANEGIAYRYPFALRLIK